MCMDVFFMSSVRILFIYFFSLNFHQLKSIQLGIYNCGVCFMLEKYLLLFSSNLVNKLIKFQIKLQQVLLYVITFCRDLEKVIHKANCNDSAMASDITINYQNILLDNLDEPINATVSMPSPLNSLVTKRNANFSHIKKIEDYVT